MLDYRPLFEKGARARNERVAEIEPRDLQGAVELID